MHRCATCGPQFQPHRGAFLAVSALTSLLVGTTPIPPNQRDTQPTRAHLPLAA